MGEDKTLVGRGGLPTSTNQGERLVIASIFWRPFPTETQYPCFCGDLAVYGPQVFPGALVLERALSPNRALVDTTVPDSRESSSDSDSLNEGCLPKG